MNKTTEVNFDGLVGPTHHYAGLSFGNHASMAHKHQKSNPRQAAKQGLAKMKFLADAGVCQGIIPPQDRPSLPLLRQQGFNGTDEKVLADAAKWAPDLLSAASSASSMWVANAATVCPSVDALDGKVHFTVANLSNKLHRAWEAPTTERLLRAIFHDERYFAVHPPLPRVAALGDEGAANHNRLCSDYGVPGVQVFVYGRSQATSALAPKRYPARQTREASQCVAQCNQVDPTRLLFVQQTPDVIDQGVFHNDVIAVANRQLLFCHQQAFVDQARLYRQIQAMIPDFQVIEVPARRVSVTQAVNTYLFNSQLVSLTDNSMMLVLPEESSQDDAVRGYLNEVLEQDNPINALHYFPLQESMANGGGPACLRLRVVLNEAERQAMNLGVMLDDQLFSDLNAWIDRWYRDVLTVHDLQDPQLLRDNQDALDALTQRLGLGAIYAFQH